MEPIGGSSALKASSLRRRDAGPAHLARHDRPSRRGAPGRSVSVRSRAGHRDHLRRTSRVELRAGRTARRRRDCPRRSGFVHAAQRRRRRNAVAGHDGCRICRFAVESPRSGCPPRIYPRAFRYAFCVCRTRIRRADKAAAEHGRAQGHAACDRSRRAATRRRARPHADSGRIAYACIADVHLGHHRLAQGCAPVARQSGARCRGRGQRACADGRGQGAVVAAPLSRERAMRSDR